MRVSPSNSQQGDNPPAPLMAKAYAFAKENIGRMAHIDADCVDMGFFLWNAFFRERKLPCYHVEKKTKIFFSHKICNILCNSGCREMISLPGCGTASHEKGGIINGSFEILGNAAEKG